MAKNTGQGRRVGAVKNREQSWDPAKQEWAKRDRRTGAVLNTKPTPYKGVRKTRQVMA